MIIDQRGNNQLVFVTDYELKSDAEEECVSVLGIPPLKRYSDYTRIALFPYKARPTPEERAQARFALKRWLHKTEPRVTICVPTVAFDPDDKAETICWSVFGAPEGLGPMRATFFEWSKGRYVCPIYGFSPFLKQLQHWQNSETLKRAVHIAHGFPLLTCPRKVLNPGRYQILSQIAGSHPFIAVDIESIEGTNKITAVGVSNGFTAISVPVDEYMPYGRNAMERGGTQEQLDALKEVLASDVPKVFHNYTFDVPRLEQHGFIVGGTIHDTFCAMAIAYPELSHGLQLSCSALLSIPPWKSLWHPKLPGISREDIEYWICDPKGLRDYNADDSFYTWHLARAVLPAAGIDL